MKKEDTYQVRISCYNCGQEELISIPKGKVVGTPKCSNCGCYTTNRIRI